MLVTHIQFSASRSRSLGFGCRSSSAPTPSGHRLSRPPSRPRCLRIVLPTEERVPAPPPRCLRGARPASRWSAGYNTVPGDAPSDRLAAAARKRRWDVLLRAVSKHWVSIIGVMSGVFLRYERLCFSGGILTIRHAIAAVCRFRVTKKRRISTTLLSCSEDGARERYSIICCTFSSCLQPLCQWLHRR